MKNVMLVFGTRPEAIKMCPIVMELRKRDGINTTVCVTGQHREMLDQVLEVFHIVPDYDLNIMQSTQTLFDITTRVLEEIKSVLEREAPDIVLVHGDTTTSFAAALACFYRGIRVGHVEAGLRTYDKKNPFPEELNRQCIGVISDLHFAPTQEARQNLINEGKNAELVYVTGNSGLDALKTTVVSDYYDENLQWAEGSRMILLTAHRRESVGEQMEEIFEAILNVVEMHENIKILFPVHKNPDIRESVKKVFKHHERVRIIEPVNVVQTHNYISRSELVLTDSGGIQEEATALHKPVLVLRKVTERPEGVATGAIRVIGTAFESVKKGVEEVLENKDIYRSMCEAVNPFGDGHASERIVDILQRELMIA